MDAAFLRSIFHHYDVQSVETEVHKVEIKNLISSRKNTTTGASAASSKFEDFGDFVENELVQSCPHFRNEIPSQTTQEKSPPQLLDSDDTDSDLETPKGSDYYRKYFIEKEHDNFLALDDNYGPIAISILKENRFWRIIFRTSELNTLRGSVPDELFCKSKSREVLESVFGLQSPLRLGNPQTTPQILLKLDEQNNTSNHKVGVLYCKAGQCTEEEMYNNEHGSLDFEEFMDFLGEKIRLRGYQGYNGGLDVRDDTTGLYTYKTNFKSFQLLFHTSPLLPFTPNNRQQLMRKRHIGNDIVTLIFQEQNSQPFTPKSIRSQFQHVFIIIRSTNFGYRVSISRSKEVPSFGPPLTSQVFKKDEKFRDFLLSKIINGENATYKSEKFVKMGQRTKYEYLKDIVCNHSLSEVKKFSFFGKKKNSGFNYSFNFEGMPGGLSWRVGGGFLVVSRAWVGFCGLWVRMADVVCYEESSQGLILHYQNPSLTSLTIPTNESPSIIAKLLSVNKKIKSTETFFIKRSHNTLGFHIQNDGVITDVDPNSPSGLVGVKSWSRVVRINSTPTSSLNSEEMIALLKNSPNVHLVVIPPELASSLPQPTSQLLKKLNHLNLQAEGNKFLISPLEYYSSSSGYGTGSSSRSFTQTPPPPIPRRTDAKNRHTVYCDVGFREQATRITTLKHQFLPQKKQTREKTLPNKNLQTNLLKLIDLDNYSIYDTTNALESRVATLEAQLVKEQATKEELKNTVEKLKRENLKLQMEHEGNKIEVERIKKVLFRF